MFRKVLKLTSCLMIVGSCFASDKVSYHLFGGSPHPVLSPISSDTEAKLQEDLAECSHTFQTADCGSLDEVAESLIPKLTEIFLGEEGMAAKSEIESLEKGVFEDKVQISSAAEKILQKRKGLPNAAYQLAFMYDQVGINNVALLWARVAYSLGSKQARQLGQQLLLKMGL